MNSQPDKSELRLDWCSHEAAKYAVMNWHYSRSMPASPVLKIGVWEGEKFIGVVLFSRGASNNLTRPYNLTQYEACELTRISLTKHKAPVSRILKVAISFLKKNSPGIRLIISFADPNQGHHGGIYQATNWVYTDVTAKDYAYWYRGKRYHSRQVSEKGYKIQFGNNRMCPKPSQCKRVASGGKHRYLMPLDKEMRKQIAPLAKPYPKRAGSIAVDALAIQAGEGGSIPTPALQAEPDNKSDKKG